MIVSAWSLLGIAFGVSADAFAVALGKGLQLRTRVLAGALLLSLAFALAQVVMPLVGWLLGSSFAESISSFDHWIAFALLVAVGGKMLWEALRRGADPEESAPRGLAIREVLLLSLATSIDALAVGVSLAFLDTPIWAAVAVIGLVTFVLCFLGVLIGHRVGRRFQRPAELIGGIALIAIGVQVLVEHLTA